MALQLRRGTDAERSAVTFADGELVYTTDTKKLYVGDGATAGGNSASADTLDSLTDTNLTGSTNNDVLTYNASTSKWESVSVPGLGRIALTDLTDVYPGPFYTGEILQFNGVQFAPTSINQIINPGSSLNLNLIADDSTIMVNATTGTFIGDLTGNAFGAHTGTLDGDLTGSVFGDDSSIIVDGINKTFSGNITGSTVMSQPGVSAEVSVNIDSEENTSKINLKRLSSTDLSGNNTIQYGTISFGRNDANGLLTTGLIFGRENSIYIGANSAGTFATSEVFMVWKDSKLGLGMTAPTEQLEMTGNAKIDGFVQFGSLTTTQRNALTAANGMVIYNSSDNKFQGYENGAWVNLV